MSTNKTFPVIFTSLVIALEMIQGNPLAALGIPKCHKTLVKTLQIIAFQSTG